MKENDRQGANDQWDAVIQHLDAQWDSERENSSRYAFRTRVLAPTATAVLGVTLLVNVRGDPGDAFASMPGWYREISVWAFFLSLVVGSSLVMLALLRILLPPQSVAIQVLGFFLYILYVVICPVRWVLDRWVLGAARWIYARIEANEDMQIPSGQEYPSSPASWNLNLSNDIVEGLELPSIQLKLVKLRLAAIADLQSRNMEKRQVVSAAERWLAWGVGWYGFAMILWITTILWSYT